MLARILRLPLLAAAALLLSAGTAWALGFHLAETKEQLKLDYQVAVADHGTGRVTVVFTLADEGRLKPLTGVHLVVPANDGSGHHDLSLAVAMQREGGKRVARVHLTRELAERAQIRLQTSTLDGKQQPLTWYYHPIPVRTYLGKG